MRQALSLAVVATLALSGCYLSTERGGTRVEAGVPADGGLASIDASVPRVDSGPLRRDSGVIVGCDREIVAPYDGPPCPDSVNACLMSCTTEECPNECIGMDPVCTRCFYTVIIECANELGCQDRWNDFACCSDSVPVCSGTSGFERLSCADACPEQIDAYSMCLNDVAFMACIDRARTTCELRI